MKSHGLSHLPEYVVWTGMRQRCNDPKHRNYKDYGGRGVKVCSRWDSFAAFYADMGKRPRGKQLDRRDNNGSYCKSNCRWASPFQQASNQRRTIRVTVNGETRSVSEWSRRTGIGRKTLIARFHAGWAGHQIVDIKLRYAKHLFYARCKPRRKVEAALK